MPSKVDPKRYIGNRYSRLTVTGVASVKPRMVNGKQFGYVYKLACRCDCGTSSIKSYTDLTSGHAKSCGCLARELVIARNIKHNETSNGKVTPEWRTWAGLKSRCYHPSNSAYSKYGAKGIKVCDRWLGENGYKNFLSDMGRRPEGKYSIDRVDSLGDYEPSNCRWATDLEQANNQKSNWALEYKGSVYTVSQLMRHFGVYTKSGVYYGRLNRGWSIERAFSTPVA